MTLKSESKKVARLLKKSRCKIVFAESCTGGMIAASLSQVPGISEHLCGSAVVYRSSTKSLWLGVSNSLIRKHTAVSRPVAIQMAKGALKKTKEADIAFSITGHLGPKAPRSKDGQIFVAATFRKSKVVLCEELKLKKTNRTRRQELASLSVLLMVRSVLQSRKGV